MSVVVLGFCFGVVGFAGKKFPLTGTSVAPAARGQVEVDTDRNGNTKVKLKVEHLAPPGNLAPPREGYILWFSPRGGQPESQGRLRIDKNLKATFESTTPMKSFDVLVTAETDAAVKTPTGPEVLKATVQQ